MKTKSEEKDPEKIITPLPRPAEVDKDKKNSDNRQAPKQAPGNKQMNQQG